MKSFTIHYNFIDPIDVEDFKDVEIVAGNNGITDYFDGAIYFWDLYIVDDAGHRYYFYEVYSKEEAEEWREKILKAIKSGKKDINREDFK